MVSINPWSRDRAKSTTTIYIPLWYLLISSLVFFLLYSPYLHSTIVSINRTHQYTAWMRQEYLHSTMVSINRNTRCLTGPLNLHLHSTMVSINFAWLLYQGYLHTIYIPLWYLLILMRRIAPMLVSLFTFHYGIY